jgi:hypothetical protein
MKDQLAAVGVGINAIGQALKPCPLLRITGQNPGRDRIGEERNPNQERNHGTERHRAALAR